jgi:hypothetical protein
VSSASRGSQARIPGKASCTSRGIRLALSSQAPGAPGFEALLPGLAFAFASASLLAPSPSASAAPIFANAASEGPASLNCWP